MLSRLNNLEMEVKVGQGMLVALGAEKYKQLPFSKFACPSALFFVNPGTQLGCAWV
jgi:hypothetical protein